MPNEKMEETSNAYDLTEQLTLGAQYLEEIRYEEALAVYNQILQITGEDADAYLGIAEVYIRQGEYDTALEYAQKGYEITGDGRLLAMSEMIESGNIVDSKNRRLRETTYDDNGKIRWWYQYTYDKKADKLEKIGMKKIMKQISIYYLSIYYMNMIKTETAKKSRIIMQIID